MNEQYKEEIRQKWADFVVSRLFNNNDHKEIENFWLSQFDIYLSKAMEENIQKIKIWQMKWGIPMKDAELTRAMEELSEILSK